ncbi:putative Integral membrane protein S linking to the trans Golgi network [Monocercomonoides exilis]|uniref:putative Integral membrane protein S linking to the trans Golgi network n=1 Tax=Monocercomonoides exilis TaxID=2049356 RepID=UPI00355A4FA4|nr:putative Integral membrane protein S linking to the trans Golgi network [Monocercomonoides exilis]
MRDFLYSSFRADIFDPPLLILQIITILCGWYFCQGIAYLGLAFLFKKPNIITLQDFMQHDDFSFSTRIGWIKILTLLIGSLLSCGLYPIVVQKSKKCWDFAISACFLDIIIALPFGGFPTSPSWWISHLITLCLLILIAEFLCAYFESKPINAPTLRPR